MTKVSDDGTVINAMETSYHHSRGAGQRKKTNSFILGRILERLILPNRYQNADYFLCRKTGYGMGVNMCFLYLLFTPMCLWLFFKLGRYLPTVLFNIYIWTVSFMFFEAFSNKSVFIFKIKLVKIAYSIFYFVKYCYFLFKPFF